MLIIIENKSQRVSKNCHCFVKTYTMLADIVCCLFWIPLKFHNLKYSTTIN